jgi:hypothetical protein
MIFSVLVFMGCNRKFHNTKNITPILSQIEIPYNLLSSSKYIDIPISLINAKIENICGALDLENLMYSIENDTIFKLMYKDDCCAYIIIWNRNDTITELIECDSIEKIQNKKLTNKLINFVSKWNFEKPKKDYISECTSICGCGYYTNRIIFENKNIKTECYYFDAGFVNNNFVMFKLKKIKN